MKLDEIEREEFQKAARPLMEWMARRLHPHTKTIVTSVSAEIVEGVENYGTTEFYPAIRVSPEGKIV